MRGRGDLGPTAAGGHRLCRRGVLPPLKVQQEIVNEIEVHQRVIDEARTVVENYRPYNSIDPD